jgi:Holliday junction resolvase RusA-like endonuclease
MSNQDHHKAVYNITPVPKPRMTQRDKWKRRPIVERYFAFRDEIRLAGVRLPLAGAYVIFEIPMPKSWSKKKKKNMTGMPHQQKPDIDNYIKGLLDAVFEDDSKVWDIRAAKKWGPTGNIIIHKREAEYAINTNPCVVNR